MPRIGVVDYGLGNIPSVLKALERVNAEPVLVSTAAGFDTGLDAVVLPGVGHFGAGSRNLREAGLVAPLKAWAASGQPFLGVCVGLQLLFERSDEDADARGLGIVEGKVRRLDPNGGLKVPHMGWNSVDVAGSSRSLSAIGRRDLVYFVHSYYVEPDPAVVAATTEYGRPFCSAIEQGNIVGVQFHPEKSGDVGRRFLARFSAEVA